MTTITSIIQKYLCGTFDVQLSLRIDPDSLSNFPYYDYGDFATEYLGIVACVARDWALTVDVHNTGHIVPLSKGGIRIQLFPQHQKK